MFNRGLVLCVALLPLLANCGGSAPHAGQPTPQAESMQRMRADIELVRAYVNGSASQSDGESAASDLVAWSGKMGQLFPASEAQKYVDLTPAMAAGAPAAMTGATEALLAAVKSADRPAAGQQLAHTEHNGCGFCHLTPYQ
jgi:hypothetical protein